MARHKDENWNLPVGDPDGKSTTHSWQSIHSALLMDIRDELKINNAELKKLNNVFGCSNFTDIPRILRGIRRKLPTRRKRRKKTA